MLLSIVSPVYMAQNIVETLVEQISVATKTITSDFEIILVEDGSKDGSWAAIERAAATNKHVKGIKFSRNFGQHFAITAGLKAAKGDYVVVMDCDLQDDPKYIPQLYKKILEGYDIIYTEKEKREHGLLKNISSKLFFLFFNFLVDDHLKGSNKVGPYSMLSRKVVNSFLSFNDYRRQYLSVLRWLGFDYYILQIEHKKRYEGKSTYSTVKMIRLALDVIVSQSDKLLRIVVGAGLALSLIAFISVIGIIISYYFKPFAPGWASIAVLIIFVGGISMLSIGICGLYIGKTYEQTKNRPLFVIDEILNENEQAV